MKRICSYEDCYRILTVRPDCEWTELRKAYKLQIKKWHPDRFHDERIHKQLAEEKIKYINIAYKQLSDYFHKYGELPTTQVATNTQTTSYSADSVSPNKSGETADNKLTPEPNKVKTRFTARHFVITLFALPLVYLFFSQKLYTTDPPVITTSNKSTAPTNINTLKQNIDSELPETHQNTNRLAITDNGGLLKNSIDDLIPEQKVDELTPKIDYFTYGSTIGDVISVQGTPDRAENDTFQYGASEIYFSEGVVIGWKRDTNYPLKAKIILKQKVEDKK